MLKFTQDMGAKVTTSFLKPHKLKAMKTKYLLLLGIIAVLGSCSSAYRTGQTPDDVYYSPVPAQNAYVASNNQQDRNSYGYNNNNYNSEDFAIRRGINNPQYRSNLSLDFGYGYSPYDYYGSSFYSPFSSYYNPYSYSGATFYPYNYNYYNSYSPYNYNSYSPYYNSYYPPVYYISKSPAAVSNYSGPRRYNMGVYSNNSSNPVYNTPSQSRTSNSVPVRTFQTPPANTTGVGNFIRRVFTPSSNNTRTYSNGNNNRSYNNNNTNNSTPERTFQTNTSSSNNSSSLSSSSSSGGGGSAPVRTFRK